MLALIFIPGGIGIIIANLFFQFGTNIKNISESNLLYDSVATKGGEGLYSKLDAKGESLYYILDGITSLTAGYLFVINEYLPMIICLIFLIISAIISLGFKDIYVSDSKKEIDFKDTMKQYTTDIKSSFKFILHSKRMKAFVLFQVVFYSLIKIVETYSGDLLVNIGIPEEQFSAIFAVLTLIGGISISLKKSIEKKFRNRTLAFLSLIYIGSCIVVGAISSLYKGISIIPIILVMYTLQRITMSIWYVLEYKYLKNFTKESMRVKLTFAYEVIGGTAASICSILGGLLLNKLKIENAFLIVGLVFLVLIVSTLDYMRSRIGLKPEEYKKEDIEFECSKNNN